MLLPHSLAVELTHPRGCVFGGRPNEQVDQQHLVACYASPGIPCKHTAVCAMLGCSVGCRTGVQQCLKAMLADVWTLHAMYWQWAEAIDEEVWERLCMDCSTCMQVFWIWPTCKKRYSDFTFFDLFIMFWQCLQYNLVGLYFQWSCITIGVTSNNCAAFRKPTIRPHLNMILQKPHTGDCTKGDMDLQPFSYR